MQIHQLKRWKKRKKKPSKYQLPVLFPYIVASLKQNIVLVYVLAVLNNIKCYKQAFYDD